jgi:phosphoribosyl 1,2-cyclic phosphate phosphodiesterase
MELTILGSGGCTVIPKPLCHCRVCEEARSKGGPYERTGPSAFIHQQNLLIDTPAEIAQQLNRARIDRIDYLLFTHLDPDHVEGFRVVEQIALDFRSWKGYPEKQIHLILPQALYERIRRIQSAYGPLVDFYDVQGFIRCTTFRETIDLGPLKITAIKINQETQVAFVYVFEQAGKKMVYGPCDIKPFPEARKQVQNADLLVIQPGIFEGGLKHNFEYPENHVSRTTLYTFEETMALAKRIDAQKILFVHMEEYWNRGYDDYAVLEKKWDNVRFSYDGMHLTV